MTEQKAIEGCKKGDRISQKHLFDAYADNMLLLCMRYVRVVPDAEELMLNGFYKFLKSIDTFVYNGNGSVGAWMKKIMVNECLMFLRKRKALTIKDETYAEQVTINDDPLMKMHAAEILKSVVQLPTGYRTVFNLYAIEGYSHKEIAAELNITEGTSKSQLSKARVMLQKELQKTGVYNEQ